MMKSRRAFVRNRSPKWRRRESPNSSRASGTLTLRRARPLRLEPLEQRTLLDAVKLLSGTVFNDLDRDHAFDPGEPGLPGWTVALQRVGVTDTLLQAYRNPTPDEWSQFGRFVTAVGSDKVLVGSHREEVPDVAEVGAAYLFDRSTGQLLRWRSSESRGRRSDRLHDRLTLDGAAGVRAEFSGRELSC